jgi:hypothetical protein
MRRRHNDERRLAHKFLDSSLGNLASYFVFHATLHPATSPADARSNAFAQWSTGGGFGFSGCISRQASAM